MPMIASAETVSLLFKKVIRDAMTTPTISAKKNGPDEISSAKAMPDRDP